MGLTQQSAIEILRQRNVLLSGGRVNITWEHDPKAPTTITEHEHHRYWHHRNTLANYEISMPVPSENLSAANWKVHRGMTSSLRARALHADCKKMQDAQTYNHPLAQQFTEVIDRYRCDEIVASEYAGERQNMNVGWEHAASAWTQAADEFGEDAIRQTFAQEPHTAYRAALEAELNGLYTKGLDKDLIPQDAQDWATEFVDRNRDKIEKGTTNQSIQYGEQIAQRWVPPPQPPKGGDGDGDGDGDGQGQGEGGGEGENPAHQSVGGRLDQVAQEMAADQKELDEMGKQQKGRRRRGDPNDDTQKGGPPIYEQLYNCSELIECSLEHHENHQVGGGKFEASGHSLRCHTFVKKSTQGLAARARQHLLSVSKTKAQKDQSHGFIDEDKLPHLCLGIPARYFEERSTERKVNTAVCLVLDGSGSMDDGHELNGEYCTTFDVMMASTIQTVKMLHSLDVRVGAYVFCDSYERGLVRIVDYEQRVLGPEMTKRLMGFRFNGGTPMGEAMKAAAPQLVGRKEPRKMMITLTDGGANSDSDPAAVKLLLNKAGIETYGFGIGYDGTKRIFGERNSVVLDEPAQLKSGMIKLFENVIGRGNTTTTRV